MQSMTENDILDIMYGRKKGAEKQVEKYPLTDIAYDEGKIVFVEIALAGFKKEEVKIEVIDNMLVVSGTHNLEDDQGLTYVMRNIAKRSFARKVALEPEYLNGDFYADMEDGILCISITPKEPKKTSITIN